MEWGILFMGPVGAGKTEAIRAISEIDVLDTDVGATDETALLKDKTTVSMDVGVLHLGDGDKLRLYGAPGQGRFDFMWEILIEQTQGLVILINHANPDPLADLQYYLDKLSSLLPRRQVPLVIGITHFDQRADQPIDIYHQHLKKSPAPFFHGLVPIFKIDARLKRDINTLMIAMVSMLEIHDRLFQQAKIA